MKKEDIHLYDIKRILLGDAPVEFLLEVLVRSVFGYLFLLVVIRVMGKRMSGKLTSTELAVMLMFGAILSSATEIPNRGLLEGCFVLVVVLLIQRLITLWTFKSQGVEDHLLGKMALMVKDGRLQLDALKSERISRNQLFRMLRSKNISNLGMIRRLYMETSGSFSIYQFKEPRPGISVYPISDPSILETQKDDGQQEACVECGAVYPHSERPSQCAFCKNEKWTTAIT